MKILRKMPVLLLAAFIATACGKKDDSGSSSSSGSGVSSFNNGINTSPMSQTNLDQIRSAFNGTSFASGLENNVEMYHVGPYYNGNYSNSGGGFDVQGCINLFGWEVGDCNGAGNMEQILIDQLQNGSVKKVISRSDNSLSYKEPVGVITQNGYSLFNYNGAQTETLNRESTSYKEMLGLVNNTNIIKHYVHNATITMVRNNQQQSVGAKVVELIYGYNNGQFGQIVTDIKRFVVSTNLPVAVNPIAVINGLYPVNYNGLQANGALSYYGNGEVVNQISSISIDRINTTYYSNISVEQLQPATNLVLRIR